MSNDEKQENPPPFSLAEGAVAAHEMLLSYVKAGFTRTEALAIVIAMITSAQR